MTLPDALVREMARVRDVVMPAYLAIGPAGAPALFLMRANLDAAARALAYQDPMQILGALRELQGFTE